MTASVFYSLSPFGVGDIKVAANITITSGVAVLSTVQTGNIGVGCCLEYNSLKAYIAPNRVGFDSGGTVELLPGTKIADATSGATGIVRYVETTSGAWASGTAAGWIYFESTTGTFGNNNEINRTKPTVSNSIATVDGTIQGNIGNGNSQFVVKAATGGDAANQSQTTLTSLHHEYASLLAFEAGFIDSTHINNTDLTAADVVAHACCYYDHDDQTADSTVAIDFGTTDAARYLKVYTPIGGAESINNQRHAGKWDGNKYKIYYEDGHAFTVANIAYLYVEGLQIHLNRQYSNRYAVDDAGLNGIHYYDKMLLRCQTTGTGSASGMQITGSGETAKISNTIIYPEGTGSMSYAAYYGGSGSDAFFNYCTFSGGAGGLRGNNNWFSKNSAVFNNTDDFNGLDAADINYTASDDGDGGNAVDWANEATDWGNVFTDYTNGDFSLKNYTASGIAIIEQGTSLASSDGIWRDIVGNERDATSPDIGAFEFVAAGDTYTLDVESGTLSLNGQSLDLLINRFLEVGAGSSTLAGQDINLLLNRLLSIDSGALFLNGQTLSLLFNRLLSSEAGLFTLTGQNIDLLLNRLLSMESGSFTLVGVDVDLILDRVLGAEAGTISLVGTDVTLEYSGSGGSTYTLAAESGSLTLIGADASLLADRLLTLDSGVFTQTGQDISLLLDRLLSTEAGLFILTGQDVTFFVNRVLDMGAGIFTLNGQDVTLTWSGSGEVLATGKLTITFTSRKSEVAFTSRKPGITFIGD